MKILHVVQNYYPSFGGTQYLFQKVSEKLVSGYSDDVTVYTTDSMVGPDNPDFIPIKKISDEINGVKIKRFKFRRWHKNPIRFLLRINRQLNLHFIKRLSALKTGPWSGKMLDAMQEFDGDIICASSSSYLYMNYPLMKRKPAKKVPFVYMGAIHFDDVSDINISSNIYKAINASDAYIANTNFEKQSLVQLGVEGEKIFVVGCGVDLNDFMTGGDVGFRKKYQLSLTTPLVGFVGRHSKDKGIDTLINAMECVWKKIPGAGLVIAGAESDYSKELKQCIARLASSLQSRIIYIPNISADLKSDLFNACDIIVNASRSESFGIVYLEAWACRKPVIGCNIEAVKSVITEGVDGLLINPGDFNQLAKHIQSLLEDRDMRREMGNAGYRKIEEFYTWDIIAQKYREVYQYAINRIKAEAGA